MYFQIEHGRRPTYVGNMKASNFVDRMVKRMSDYIASLSGHAETLGDIIFVKLGSRANYDGFGVFGKAVKTQLGVGHRLIRKVSVLCGSEWFTLD